MNKNYTVKLKVDEEIQLDKIIEGFDEHAIVETDSLDSILLYDGKLRGLVGGEIARVAIKSKNKQYCFDVEVENCSLAKEKLNDSLINNCNIKPLMSLQNRKDFTFGADISTVSEVLRCGGKFYNEKGNQESIFSLLKKGGYDCIRLRLWNDPNFDDGTPYGGGHNDINADLFIAKIAKAMGMKVMLNFHYSDFWADPGIQRIPKEWSNLTCVRDIEKAIYEYTQNVLTIFKNSGVEPDWVQVGNEITNGLLQHKVDNKNKLPRKIRGDFNRKAFLKYVNAGCNAVREFNDKIKLVIHIDRGADDKVSNKFYKRISRVDYDIIGLSYYSFFHGDLSKLVQNMSKLALKFNKPIIIAETSYAFTSTGHKNAESVFSGANSACKKWEISPQGQADKLRDIAEALLNLPNKLGIGLYYWEPCWLPIENVGWAKRESKASWSDQALFSYDGVKLPSLDTPKMLKKT